MTGYSATGVTSCGSIVNAASVQKSSFILQQYQRINKNLTPTWVWGLSALRVEIITGSSSHCWQVHGTASWAGEYIVFASIDRITQKAQPLEWPEGKMITIRHRNGQSEQPSIVNLYWKLDRSPAYYFSPVAVPTSLSPVPSLLFLFLSLCQFCTAKPNLI
jgi:hypothetical protein